MTLPRHATRHRTRRKLATGAPTAADLLAWELCWNSVDGKLWIGTGDDGNGNATGVAQLTGAGVSVAWADITGKPAFGTASGYNIGTSGAAVPLLNGTNTWSGEIRTTASTAYRSVYGNYGTFWLNNGVDLYLMLTAIGDQYGSYNSLRPFTVNLSSGLVKFGEKVTFGKSFYLAANDGGYTSAGYTAQGMWLAWNPSNGRGESAFVNNQGGGSGGFAFVNRTFAGVYSVLATLAPTGAALNSQTLGSGVLRINALGLPGTTSQYVRGDGSLATLPAGGSGDITGVTAGDGLTGGATSGNATVSMGTPGTCTASTGNSATGSTHTHNITGFLTAASPSFTGTLTGPALTLGGGDKLTKISVQSTTPSSSSANDGTLYLIY